jgi:LmbE family N-acetylglucosaminyl deacetylase
MITNFKKRRVLAVFAHPDDEAFGPSGTLALLSKYGEVQLICATNGNDPGRPEDLTKIRQQELQQSAEVLGISKVIFWDYDDGHLCNHRYHELVKKIAIEVERYQPDLLITFENRGVSGHLDHIALAMILNYGVK